MDAEESGDAWAHLRDPDDRKFLELAREGRAEFFVTGDRDLLALPEPFGFRIIAPADLRVIISPS